MDEDISAVSEGVQFLVERGLLAPAVELDDGMLFGITEDGLRAIYMLSMVMAAGTVADEVKESSQSADARQVAHRAGALVKALDEIGVGA